MSVSICRGGRGGDEEGRNTTANGNSHQSSGIFFSLTKEGRAGKLDQLNLFLKIKPKYGGVTKTVSQL